MRDLQKRLVSIAAATLAMSVQAEAANFWEAMFGIPDHRLAVPSIDNRDPAARPAARPRRAKTSAPSELRIRQRVKVVVIHGSGPADSDAVVQDYLRSPEFTRRFSVGGDGATKEAVSYLLKHDTTLRPGDAVVTRAGVMVLDGEAFVSAANFRLHQSLRERFLAFNRPMLNKAREQPAAQDAQEPARRPDAPLAFGTRVTDGQPIRYVGGM